MKELRDDIIYFDLNNYENIETGFVTRLEAFIDDAKILKFVAIGEDGSKECIKSIDLNKETDMSFETIQRAFTLHSDIDLLFCMDSKEWSIKNNSVATDKVIDPETGEVYTPDY